MLLNVADLPPDPLAGTRYRVIGFVGYGGSSDVYEATGPSGDRYAIKVLRTHHNTQEFATRLLQEGRILSSINHDNLIPVREMGMTRDGRPFLAMPRMRGMSLRQYLTQHGPMEPKTATLLLAGALDGLAEAHKRGIVHRDVKPGNIFIALGADGKPRRALVFDFGIAKFAGGGAYRTSENAVLGTPRYIAPEQILGGKLDGRVDIYAMGIVLFESIAARGPYDVLRAAEFSDHIRAHLSLTPRKLDDLSPASSALARVVHRALEKAPGKRYPSAEAFAEALRRVFRGGARRTVRTAVEGGLS